MAQRASIRDQASLTIQKRRSNRTAYFLSRALEDAGRIAGMGGGSLRPRVG
jgi:hypothetical protein